MRLRLFLITTFCTFINVTGAFAETPNPQPVAEQERRAALQHIARSFVTKITKGFDNADAAMGLTPGRRALEMAVPEGEDLILNLSIKDAIILEAPVVAQVRNRQVLVSLRDYFSALQFPIEVEAGEGKAEGWFIRENNSFVLDMNARTVRSGNRDFAVSDQVKVDGNDIFAPANEVASWFAFKSKTILSNLQLRLESDVKLPIEEQINRRDRKGGYAMSKPQNPLIEDPIKDLAFPLVDVSSTSAYTRDRNGQTHRQYGSTVATRGDLKGGRLTTASQFSDREKLTSLRAGYTRESFEADLLGPLKARRYQLGDLNTPRLPMGESAVQGMGVRASNIDPSRVYTGSTTGITGSAPPGWDVELYRGNVFLESQPVSNDGTYNFDNVNLFRSSNNFRVILYGPQGEVREEAVSVPVDPSRLALEGTAYDVSVSMDDRQLYRKNLPEDNSVKPRLAAVYEKPVGAQTAVQAGFSSALNDAGDARLNTVHSGLSTVLGPVLFNAEMGLEDTGEAGAEFTNRFDIGKHNFRNTTTLATEEFSTGGVQSGRVFENNFIATGPLGKFIGRNPHYNLNLNLYQNADENMRAEGSIGYSGSFKRISVNQSLDYSDESFAEASEAGSWHSKTALRGFVKGVYIRGDIDYEITPEPGMYQVSVDLEKYINDRLSVQFNHTEYPKFKNSSDTIQADIRTKAVTISPSISRNSEGDITALLSSSFGLSRDRGTGKFVFSNQQFGASGALVANVFVDKNGNGLRDEGEEPVEEAVVIAPQNGGQAITGKDGYAHFSALQAFRHSDLYIRADSLVDPFWLPSSKGVSFIPREGHVTEVNLPVVLGGQLEGNVLIQGASDERTPARGATISLYNHAGEKVMSALSESDGYYIFSPIPPGDYMLTVDSTGQPRDMFARPEPTPVNIGYDGKDITGKNIYLPRGIDVPVRMVETATIEKQDPAMKATALDGKDVVLNLGVYNSRVLMGLVWFKTQKQAGGAVAGLTPLVDPSASYADTKTGEHTLRIGAHGLTMKAANDRCRVIVSVGMSCTVEVLPGGMVVADAAHAITK